MRLKVGLDLDDTICDFRGQYFKRFGTPKEDYEITKNVTQVLINDRNFWINLPVIHRPNFNPTLYCTKRISSKAWSKQFLEKNNLPIAPIYQVFCQTSSKAPKIKGRVDVFIDDSISNFIDLNLSGIPCLLMNGNHNQDWGPVGRLYSLDREEVEDCFHLFRGTMFNYFNDILDEYRKQLVG